MSKMSFRLNGFTRNASTPNLVHSLKISGLSLHVSTMILER